MFLSALSSAIHYILHTIDRQSEDPWENKTIYIRIVDIVLGNKPATHMVKHCHGVCVCVFPTLQVFLNCLCMLVIWRLCSMCSSYLSTLPDGSTLLQSMFVCVVKPVCKWIGFMGSLPWPSEPLKWSRAQLPGRGFFSSLGGIRNHESLIWRILQELPEEYIWCDSFSAGHPPPQHTVRLLSSEF